MHCSVVYPGQAWATQRPVAVSDTVDNIGGTTGIVARALHNRSAASALVSIIMEGGEERVSRILSGGDLAGGSQWKRLRATGTTGAGSSGGAYEVIHQSAAGAAFTNQPANDGVELVSSSAADTTQSATLWYTRNGTGDTISSETVALNGTTQVVLTDVDVALVLGVELSAECAGTITVREASGNATITTITAGNLRSGVELVAASTQSAYNTPPTVVASGTSTKQLGLVGTAPDGTARLDSQALTGATALPMNSTFATVTKVLTGDVESTRTVTVNVSADFLAYY